VNSAFKEGDSQMRKGRSAPEEQRKWSTNKAPEDYFIQPMAYRLN